MGTSSIHKALLFLAAACVGLYLSLPIWKVARSVRQDTEQAKAELKQVQAAQAEKISEQSKLTNPAGREEYIRRQGYKKNNERKLDLN